MNLESTRTIPEFKWICMFFLCEKGRVVVVHRQDGTIIHLVPIPLFFSSATSSHLFSPPYFFFPSLLFLSLLSLFPVGKKTGRSTSTYLLACTDPVWGRRGKGIEEAIW
jgi:hypothetical protein